MIENLKRYKIQIIVLLIIVISIPLTLIQLSRQQETRSRATGAPSISLNLNPLTSTQQLNTQFDVALTMNTGTNNITAVDITITYDSSILTLISFTPASTFATMVNDSQTIGTLHYVGTNPPGSSITGAAVSIGSLKFKGTTTGTAGVRFTDIQASAEGQGGTPLPIDTANTKPGSYVITESATNACPAGQGNYIAGRIFVDNGAGAHARNGVYDSDESGFYSNGQSYDPNQPNYNSAGINVIFITQMTGPGYYVGSAIVGTTATNGCYLFQNLPGIQYQIEYHIPSGYVQTTIPGSIYVCHSQPYCQEWPSSNQYNFGLGLASAISPTPTPIPTRGPTSTPTPTPAPPHTISGTVFIDTNGNGVLDTGEAGYNGANLLINPATQDLIYQTNTNSSGAYSFINVSSGTKTITLNIPSGYIISNGGASPNTNPRSVTVQTAEVPNVNFGITSTTPNFTPVPRISPTPTQGPIPTPCQGADPNCNGTQIALKIGLDSIGSVGDSTNPDPSASTKNPVHTTRNVTVELYNSSESLVSKFDGTVQYNSTTGIFTGTVLLGQTAGGNYIVKIRSLGYLRRRLPGITTLVVGQTYNANQVNLVTGDLNGDNRMDIADYNILNDCIFAPAATHGTVCSQNPDYAAMSDLNDNGIKNILDYSLFVRELIVRDGD